MSRIREIVWGSAIFLCAGLTTLVLAAQFAPWQPPRMIAPIPLTPIGDTDPCMGLATVQHDVTVTRRDGSIASGWLVLPVDQVPDLASVIIAGSGPSARDDVLPLATSLASEGVAVLVVDKRGEGYSLFHRDFDALAEDTVDAGHFLATHHLTSHARLAVIGVSEGGWIASRAAAEEPELFSAVALISAPIVSPLVQSLWIVDRALGHSPIPVRRAAAAAVAGGRDFLDYLDEDSDVALSKLTVPIFAMWGADDAVVPVASAHSRLTELVTSPVTSSILADNGHAIPQGEWIPSVARWLVDTQAATQKNDHGAQVSDRLGAPKPPPAAWYLAPHTHALIALGATIPVVLLRRNRRRDHP